MTGSVSFPKPLLLGIALVGFAIIAVLGLILWSSRRHREPRLHLDTPDSIDAMMRSLAGLSLGTVVEGNRVEVGENGAYVDEMLDAIAGAERSVHFETFLWKEGELGARLADILCNRARAGVTVRLLLDANGTRNMGAQVEQRLRDCGCKLSKFHPAGIATIGKLNRRDHRKLAVIDGRLAFVCGHCIVDHWLGDAHDDQHWRDVGVRITGPVVHSVQSVFSENWIESTGELFAGDDVFPRLDREGDVVAHVAHAKPEGSASAVKILHHAVICCARKRLWLQNPYFIPDPEAIEAYGRAVDKGVDVRVMVPSAQASDLPMVQHAAHRNFGKLLARGVRIFEYSKTLLHQKVMTVDSKWCAIGSTNFDDRAFEINDEITVGFLDERLTRQFEKIFEKDLEECVELDLESWNARGLLHKCKDEFFYLFNEQM